MLSLEHVTVEYSTQKGLFKAVDDVSLTVHENETFALIGESGSGKTTLALSIFSLLKDAQRSGTAHFNHRSLFTLPEPELRRMLGRDVGIVFQNPYRAFDPVYKIGVQIAEACAAHLTLTKSESHVRVARLLEMVELDSAAANRYPHELSGGMLQRAQLAVALCCSPPLLIADEPTSSLDVVIQAQIVDLLNNLKRDKKLTLFIITHDLGVVASLADSVAVMRGGKIVESGTAEKVLSSPSHTYTKQLLESDTAYR